MKLRIWIPFVTSIILIICSATTVVGSDQLSYVVFDQSHDRLVQFNETVTKLYDYAALNNKQAVFQRIQSINRQLQNSSLKRYGTESGWEFVEQQITQLEKRLANGQSIRNQEHINALRLASDALVNEDYGLWLQYERLLLDDLGQTKLAWSRLDGNRHEAASAMMNMMKTRILRIQGAALMVGNELRLHELNLRIEQLNELFKEGEEHWNSSKEAEVKSAYAAIESAISAVFNRSKEVLTVPAPNMMSPLTFTLLIGAFISALLTYTGWRKYKQNPFGTKPIDSLKW